jgi:hypothetical protein
MTGRGTLHIAEVTSRLVYKEGFIALIEAFGFDLEEHVSIHCLSTLLNALISPDLSCRQLRRPTSTSSASARHPSGLWEWCATRMDGMRG